MATVIVVQTKSSPISIEAFSSIPAFIEAYPLYNIWNVRKSITRLKRAFEDEKLVVMRVKLNGRAFKN